MPPPRPRLYTTARLALPGRAWVWGGPSHSSHLSCCKRCSGELSHIQYGLLCPVGSGEWPSLKCMQPCAAASQGGAPSGIAPRRFWGLLARQACQAAPHWPSAAAGLFRVEHGEANRLTGPSGAHRICARPMPAGSAVRATRYLLMLCWPRPMYSWSSGRGISPIFNTACFPISCVAFVIRLRSSLPLLLASSFPPLVAFTALGYCYGDGLLQILLFVLGKVLATALV